MPYGLPVSLRQRATSAAATSDGPEPCRRKSHSPNALFTSSALFTIVRFEKRLRKSAPCSVPASAAAEKMKSYGLTNVALEGWTIPVGWERGTATGRIVEPDNGRSLLFAS